MNFKLINKVNYKLYKCHPTELHRQHTPLLSGVLLIVVAYWP